MSPKHTQCSVTRTAARARFDLAQSMRPHFEMRPEPLIPEMPWRTAHREPACDFDQEAVRVLQVQDPFFCGVLVSCGCGLASLSSSSRAIDLTGISSYR
jgi:hypothetical protein